MNLKEDKSKLMVVPSFKNNSLAKLIGQIQFQKFRRIRILLIKT